jgi:hypothetical protein
VALIESEDIDTTGFDGLMGMAFEALSDTGASPVFDKYESYLHTICSFF